MHVLAGWYAMENALEDLCRVIDAVELKTFPFVIVIIVTVTQRGSRRSKIAYLTHPQMFLLTERPQLQCVRLH